MPHTKKHRVAEKLPVSVATVYTDVPDAPEVASEPAPQETKKTTKKESE